MTRTSTVVKHTIGNGLQIINTKVGGSFYTTTHLKLEEVFTPQLINTKVGGSLHHHSSSSPHYKM